MNHTQQPERLAGPRRQVRRVAAVAAVLTLAFVAACGSSGSASGGSKSSSQDAALLGPKKLATGEPIKIGTVSDGRTPALDNTLQLEAATATTRFLNEHRGGLGGLPIKLVPCVTGGDPGKAADCATQLIQANVVATVMGASTAAGIIWKPLHDAHIPIFVFGDTNASVLLDRDSTFVFADQASALSSLPISVAKAHHLTKVTAVVIDVPVVTGFYKAVGQDLFQKAGIKLNLVAIPLGQADMTPQMTRIASSGPTEVHILGNDSFCIAAFNGLRAANFTGPISIIDQCVDDAMRKAVGSYLKGVVEGTTSPGGDGSDRGLLQYAAIMRTYGYSKADLSNTLGTTTFTTMMAMSTALEGIRGPVTSDSIIAKVHSAPELPLTAGGGMGFRCNGKASPLTPAVCTRGNLETTLDAKGNPTLPYRKVGTSPIGD